MKIATRDILYNLATAGIVIVGILHHFTALGYGGTVWYLAAALLVEVVWLRNWLERVRLTRRLLQLTFLFPLATLILGMYAVLRNTAFAKSAVVGIIGGHGISLAVASISVLLVFRWGKPIISIFLGLSIAALHDGILTAIRGVFNLANQDLVHWFQRSSYVVLWLVALLLTAGILRLGWILVIPAVANLVFDLYWWSIGMPISGTSFSFADVVEVVSWMVASSSFVISFYLAKTMRSRELLNILLQRSNSSAGPS